ncbi:MAG: 5-oxoprolinase subunit PxpB [Geodermatophilaceae bacterium]
MIEVRPYGEHALLALLPADGAVLALAAALTDDPVDGVVELVPAAQSLLLRLAPGSEPARVAEQVRGRSVDPAAAPTGELVRIPVSYDGPDLPEVARLCGLSEQRVVELHTAAELTVAFCGFAPGFGYLTGLPPELTVDRRVEPRTRVPAGAVGLAGSVTGVYPRESPGGWQLIGRTDVVLFDLDRDPPALLRPGGRVRFEAR